MKKKFRLVIAVLISLLLIGSFVGVYASSESNTVNINADGYEIEGILVDGTTFVPVRTLSEALGRTVAWEQETLTVTVESRLDTILDRGYIKVGTAGDYRPFTYLNPETGQFEGHDIDAAKMLAEEMGVEVEFVQTSWPTLMDDLLDDKFDIAMGGITRRMGRQLEAQFSHPYILFGKSPLIRVEDKDRFTSLEEIDQSDVTIGVNPGGTNEIFVNENIENANIVVHERNEEIPGMVADGTFDVMITDSIEAIVYARDDDRLHDPLSDDPFTREKFGYMMQRGDPIFLNTINFWMEEMELKGHFDHLWDKWIQ